MRRECDNRCKRRPTATLDATRCEPITLKGCGPVTRRRSGLAASSSFSRQTLGYLARVGSGWVGRNGCIAGRAQPESPRNVRTRMTGRWSVGTRRSGRSDHSVSAAASGRGHGVRPGATADDVRAVAEQIASARRGGVQLLLVDASTEKTCALIVRAKRAIETSGFADRLASAMSSDESFSGVDPPRAIELPAGPSFVIVSTKLGSPVGPTPLIIYLIGSGRRSCSPVALAPSAPTTTGSTSPRASSSCPPRSSGRIGPSGGVDHPPSARQVHDQVTKGIDAHPDAVRTVRSGWHLCLTGSWRSVPLEVSR